MNKIRCLFFGVLLCSTSLFAQIEYEYEHKFVLKKDEVGLVLINHKEVTKKPTADNPNNEYLLNYRGYPTQYVLEQKYPLESIVIPLLPDGENKILSKTYARIVFTEFDKRNKEAILDIFIEDNQQRLEVEFKPKKKP